MIIVNKFGQLKYKNFNFKCAFGRGGVGKKRCEGDNITPKGVYRIVKAYFRRDRIKKFLSQLKLIEIKKNMAWCDDPESKEYNKLISLPNKHTHEKFYRKDNIYDLLLVLDYNMNLIVKNKGSAIFIHVAKRNYQQTQGCIVLKKNDLIKLTSEIKKNEKIKIN